MKCIKFTEIGTGEVKIERVTDQTAHKEVKNGYAEYVPKRVFKHYRKTGEVLEK